MRFKTDIPADEILGICRSHLLPGPWPYLPAFLGSLEPPDFPSPDALILVGGRLPLRVREGLSAALILFEPEAGTAESFGGIPALQVRSVHAALADLIPALEVRFERLAPFAPGTGNRIAAGAVVEGCLEGNVIVEAGAVVEAGAFVGAGSRIGARAVVHAHARLGRGCVVQAGAVIGSQGFGFFPGDGGARHLPHAGGVDIGDGCWLGANSVVAAGVLRPTVLGPGCKVDSLVQIAHNVRIGEGAMIAAHCGIAGSTVIGKRFRMGGSAGLNGHIRIGDDVTVAAFSGVTKDLPDGATVAGFPALPIREWRRQQVRLKSFS